MRSAVATCSAAFASGVAVYGVISEYSSFAHLESLETGQSSTSTKIAQSSKPKPKLKQVQVIFRHGARTPVFPCPKLVDISMNLCSKINPPPGTSFDAPPTLPGVFLAQLHVTDLDGKTPRPLSKVDRYQANHVLKGDECRLGQLTELGARQSSDLGKMLRERYNEEIDLSAENIYARSTNIGRCLATLSGVLGGLLDLGATDRKHEIVPVRTTSNHLEYMTPNHKLCEILKVYFRKGRSQIESTINGDDSHLAHEMKEFFREHLHPEVFDATNLEKNNFIRIFDWITILKYHENDLDQDELKQMNLDKIISKEGFYANLSKHAAREVATLFGCHSHPKIGSNDEESYDLDKEAKTRLKHAIGLFLKELSDNVNAVDSNTKSFFLFSGHDTTLVPLLIALGIYDFDWPRYCSNVLIEVWDMKTGDLLSSEDSGESVTDLETPVASEESRYEVRLIYNGEERKRMSLSEFNKIYADLIPKDETAWKRHCADVPAAEKKILAGLGPAGTSF